MSWGDPIFEGDLVMWLPYEDAPHWTKKHDGKIGFVTDRRRRWPNDARDDEMIITVLYLDSGTEVEWSDQDLEVLDESR